MQLTLYYAPRACSLVPLVTLHEADAVFDIVNINLSRQQHQDPAYLKINPKHKVPVLALGDYPLTENVAIQIWIARAFPQARLMPADPMSEIQAISLLAWCASGIHPALTPNAQPGKFCDVAGTEDSVRRLAQMKLRENYRIADELLAGREWFFEHFTAADAYFFWCFRRGLLFNIDLSEFGNCTAHFERMLLRASVQKALAYEASTLELFSRQA